MEKSDRKKILEKVYSDLKQNIGNIQQINFSKINKDEFPPSSYRIDLKITSIVDFEKDKIETKDIFHLNLFFPDYYPQVQPIIKFTKRSDVPFHPHIKTQKKYWMNVIPYDEENIWMDYQEYDSNESISSYILRMTKSLQFHPRFIKKDYEKIGDKEALVWFIQKEGKNIFPIDPTEIVSLTPYSNQEQVSVGNSQPITSKIPNSPTQPNRIVLRKSILKEKKFNIDNSETTKVKFNIVEETPAYSPQPKPKPNIPIFENSSAQLRNQYDNNYEIYIDSNARKEVLNHIEWGNLTSKNNRIEQGGILLGDVYVDTELGITYGVVWKSIPADYTEGSPISLEMSHESWKKMIDEIDTYHLSPNGSPPQIIGWYHTHPNTLDVFMSSTDLATQQRLFGYDWQFAIVLNPHKKIWRAFHGADAKSCKGFFIKKDDEENFIPENSLITAQSLPTVIENDTDGSLPTTNNIKRWHVKAFSIGLILFLVTLIIILVLKLATENTDTFPSPVEDIIETPSNSIQQNNIESSNLKDTIRKK